MVKMADVRALAHKWVRITTKSGAIYEGLCNPGTRKGKEVCLLTNLFILNRNLTIKAHTKRSNETRAFALSTLAKIIWAEK